MKVTLAALRVNAGLSQREAASRAGVTQQTLVNWEKGRVDPPFRMVQELCTIYGCTVDNVRWV